MNMWHLRGVLPVALATGTAWMFNDPDFGTTLDLASSFGMTTFGGGFQNLTPTSVATQMNVKVPK
ncbi:MAG: hypothetical protein JZU52_19515 [Lamprocystis purpurea]|jgi:hypothetical protein|uniref:hypothetical protein n=1 Tax=Lamprocystis purpurea TaxID=61598 RepID=UPI000369C900|nr:hypothetical protein [Lamprocystis purpurea]MBV5275727.1 hypothetical protein [Lamprocystis purpurea]